MRLGFTDLWGGLLKQPFAVLAYHRNDLRTLGTALSRMGVRVLVLSRVADLIPTLEKATPDLLVLDRQMAEHLSPVPNQKAHFALPAGALPVVMVAGANDPGKGTDFFFQSLRLPVDVRDLHHLLQENLKNCPRRDLRIRVKLPGILFHDGEGYFTDILSLGTGGAFIKTSMRHIGRGALIELGVPLLGLRKELELRSRVLYQVHPCQENNYQQGIGVSFIGPEGGIVRELEKYINYALLMEPAEGTAPLRSLTPWDRVSSHPSRPRQAVRLSLRQ